MCVLIALCIFIFPLILKKAECDIELSFSPQLWEEKENKRIYMYKDLTKKYDLKSMSKDEIYTILGTSTCVAYENTLTYTLGRRSDSWFVSYLYITFDENDNVIDVLIYED